MRARYLLAGLGLGAAVAARPAEENPRRDVDPASQSSSADPCAAAASSQAASLQTYTPVAAGDIVNAAIDAQTAWDCVQSVSFDADGAKTMLPAIRSYMSLHTGVSYLKNPPAAYQQPAVDIMGRLDDITSKVNSGAYTKQWDFDSDLYSIEVAVHDEHFNIQLGTLGLFNWMLPYRLVTISSDGKALPQVYVYEDVNAKLPNLSPVMELGGKSVFDYLHDYNTKQAAAGLSDPHAEWNVLMWNDAYQFGASGADANGVSYQPNNLESTKVYNGPSLKGRFANGTTFEWPYAAGCVVNLQDSQIDSGKAIVEKVIVNPSVQPATPTVVNTAAISTAFNEPESTPAFATPTFSTTRETYTAVPYGKYPVPDTKQDSFGLGGTVSGYLLQDVSVGVLSLPSFEAQDAGKASFASFSKAVASFINKANGMKKVVIDIRGNTGGFVMLAYDTFQQFFPTTEPTLRFRTRATDTLNTMGTMFTDASRNTGGFLTSYGQESALEQVGTAAFINSALTLTADDQAWGDWKDFYGPNNIHGDQFTNLAKHNLSSQNVMKENGGVYVAGYGDRGLNYAQPWDAQDIIILSDGVCGSTCSIFAELMKTDGGVRFVAAGGIPENGPMQAVAGTRGMNVIEYEWIGTQVLGTEVGLVEFPQQAQTLLQGWNISLNEVYALPRPVDTLPWKLPSARFNSLDAIRASAPNAPLQFTYEAADCRMFYTGDMIRDVTVLWRAAAKALDSGDDICIKGSRDAKGVKPNDTVTGDPGISNDKVWKAANTTDKPSAAPQAISAPTTTLLTCLMALALALFAL